VRTIRVASENPVDVIQPLKTVELTKEYQDRSDDTIAQPGVVAVFPISVASADNQIHVVFDRTAIGSSPYATCKECVVDFPVDKLR